MIAEENKNVIHLDKEEMRRQRGNKDFQSQGGQDVLVGKRNTKLINQIKELYIYLKLQR